jgi:hypothetical protein
MKKIDKSKILSKNYEEWLASLGEEHPKYNSSNNKYYNDIKMSLLYCQNGLCAYTEEELCDEDLIHSDNWDSEKYIYAIDKNISLINGDLEHFDESLKEKQAWLWDNLFFVQGDINRKIKCSKSIQEILKPDASAYDPHKYLSFDYKRNMFMANEDLTQQEQEDVECMIITLGLNANAFKRKRQINKLVKALKFDIEIDEPYEYITSWNMTLKQLKGENNND